jgi:diaminohydroxyphosphoribosylaminopyrimidine deaminase / 5-amino-6-(5-phosphoribosylamino)uracil reductase
MESPHPHHHQSSIVHRQSFIKRTIQLARTPGAAVEPNPRVGAVIVHNNKIIGEGAHEHFGGPHAEVNAIRSVTNPDLLKNATLYVTLEPCNHTGKTPPCTELILEKQIPRVVIGTLDPNPQMSGKSVAYLREKGVEVEVLAPEAPLEKITPSPDLATELKALIQHFEVNQRYKRPYILLKWSESADGFISGKDIDGKPEPRAISSAETNRHFHWLRHEFQAIWVGKNTARVDNPSLTTRNWPGRNPLRLVMDRDLTLSRNLNMFQGGDTIILNSQLDRLDGNVRYWRVEDSLNLGLLLERLYKELQIGSIMVEGGRNFTQQFLDARIWDAIIRCTSPKKLGSGTPAPTLPAGLLPQEIRTIGTDKVEFFEQ